MTARHALVAAQARPRLARVLRARMSSVQDLVVVLAVVGAPLLVFAPALWNGFVWDDHYNFEANPGYRGVSWSHLQWMFTNNVDAHWIPLTWMTFAIDYLLWGMNPAGYHLSNLVLHALTAYVLFLVAVRLLRLAAPSADHGTCIVGAAAASMFFSIHPLRTESVAWITERRDVVSGLFFLLAVLTYLRAQDPECERRPRWMAASIGSFQLAVLAKSIAITLPLILLLIDVYPLRRLQIWPLRWWRRDNRRILLEKLPFLPMAVLAGVVATSTIGGLNRFTPLAPLERLAAVTYSFSFYLWKTLLPLHLSPLYEMPDRVDAAETRFVVGALVALAVSVAALLLARRWPAGLAAWVAYLIMVGPVSGVKHTGVQLVADRYSYLSCMPWALLFGAGVVALVQAPCSGRLPRRLGRLLSTSVAVWLLVLAALASHQTLVWRTPEILWRYASTSDASCFLCQHNLGTTLLKEGQTPEAIEHLERAAVLRPSAPLTHAALVMAYVATGTWSRADDHLEALRGSDPELARDLHALFITTW